MSNTVVIIHPEIDHDAAPDEMDVLIQAETISDALTGLGYHVHIIPFELDIRAFTERLCRLKPCCVFNLVEALDNDGRLIHLACSILDHLGIPYTGAGTEAMFLTSNKVMAKRWMLRAGIPTPEWVVQGKAPECDLPFPDLYIIKTLWEEASIGIDSESVQGAADLDALMRRLDERSGLLGRTCFAERFIDGREFNLSILAGREGPQVLPPAEIVFSFPDDRPRIVDYKAKWDEGSLEYRSTTRTFEFKEQDSVLLGELEKTALSCWEAFDLKGYARVDFRVDGRGRPYVLEINANPCISPDSGFTAASKRAALSFPETVGRILRDAMSRGRP